MKYFQSKLSMMVPVIKEEKRLLSLEQGLVFCAAEMEFLPEGDYYSDIPYLRVVEEHGVKNLNKEAKRVFIVAEEENIAIKVAHAYAIYPTYESREEIKAQLSQQGYVPGCRITVKAPDGGASSIRVVRLQGAKKPETIGNPFQMLAVGVNEENTLFFNGLEEDSNLADKIEVLETCPAKLQFVQITKEQLHEPWVRNLMMERNSEVLMIPRVSDHYYTEVLRKLLSGERYPLSGEIRPEQLVRSIRKKCGNNFREEDLAWSLDFAVVKARAEKRFELQAKDFSLEKEEIGSSLHRLQEMTGLSELKITAKEYAALSKEQIRNEKMEIPCRHMIFSGDPGSGKTMSGGILAEILSEEGQSNGSFVIATRRDIIGEYVGQTAPKVKALFDRARHGVLFVDEAGFFLQENRGGFACEAMKEFVRYMEIYQDVVVIFALYPHETEGFMQLDAGLSSRIGRIVKFENYTEDELIEIGNKMCEKRGYQMDKTVEAEIKSYLTERKKELKEMFGNAREMRKLVEAAIMAKSVRCYEEPLESTDRMLIKEDFFCAMQKFTNNKPQKRRTIGFVYEEERVGV